MATTTGTYYFTVSRDDIITAALQEIKYLDALATPIAQDLTLCTLRMNAWLAFLSTQGLWLWTFDQLVLPLAANQASYTIGAGGYLNTYRPLRVLDGTFIRYTLNGSNYDSPLRIISRQEYDSFGSKGSLGITNSIYYDNQMGTGAYDPTTAKGVLYSYPTSMDNTRSAYLQVQRPIQYVTSGTDNFDVSPEMYRLLFLGLAAEVANVYETPDDLTKRIEAKYQAALTATAGWSTTEQASVYMQPDTSQYRRR